MSATITEEELPFVLAAECLSLAAMFVERSAKDAACVCLQQAIDILQGTVDLEKPV